MILSIIFNKVGSKKKIYETNTYAKTCIEFNAYLIKLLPTSKANFLKKNWYKYSFLYYNSVPIPNKIQQQTWNLTNSFCINPNSNFASAGIKNSFISNMLLQATKAFA